MSSRIIFDHFITCEPTTWKRHRGRGRRAYTDPRALLFSNALGWEVKVKEPKLRVSSTARFGYSARFHLRSRGDGDNYEKLLMDALTGIVWEDDEQIDEGTWWKQIREDQPGIRLTIYVIE